MKKAKILLTLVSISLSFPFLYSCAAVVAGTAATGAIIVQDRRTTGTIVEDKSIQLKASRMVHDILGEQKDSHVSVISYNNHVLLVGQVPSQLVKERIEQRVSTIEKVIKVHNEMTIAAPTSSLARSNDSWITTKIKSEMTLTKRFNATRVKVITEDGIVYLMGIVSRYEEEIAVDIARYTQGVKKVVKIFEYEN